MNVCLRSESLSTWFVLLFLLSNTLQAMLKCKILHNNSFARRSSRKAPKWGNGILPTLRSFCRHRLAPPGLPKGSCNSSLCAVLGVTLPRWELSGVFVSAGAEHSGDIRCSCQEASVRKDQEVCERQMQVFLWKKKNTYKVILIKPGKQHSADSKNKNCARLHYALSWSRIIHFIQQFYFFFLMSSKDRYPLLWRQWRGSLLSSFTTITIGSLYIAIAQMVIDAWE